MNSMFMMTAAGEGMSVSSAISGVTDVINAVVSCVTGNPVILVFIGIGVVGAGVGLFRKLMKAGK
ncbi:MAG: hypothetical protein NC320_12475 [Clostridium sp.]|nr:hypothetical protein [Clostridium sp.]